MPKKNLTIRVDEHLKQASELACEQLGTTLTAVVHRALYQVIRDASVCTEVIQCFNQQSSLGPRIHLSMLSHDDLRLLKQYLGDVSDD